MKWGHAHTYVLAVLLLLMTFSVFVYYIQTPSTYEGVLWSHDGKQPLSSNTTWQETIVISKSTSVVEHPTGIPKNDVARSPQVEVYPTKPPSTSAVSATAPKLVRRPRIMCMLFTTPGNWAGKATAVRETWATRCDVAEFFYSREAGFISGAVALDIPEGRAHLTDKTMAALRISFAKYRTSVDWFLKADDDTYVIIENLRALLVRHDPSKPHYIGGRSMDILRTGYNGGGAGYSLSREAARLVVEQGNSVSCRQHGSIEDLDMGDCLARLRVYPINTLDSEDRLVFHPDHPLKILQGDKSAVAVYTYTAGNHTFGNKNGIRVMSPHMISFHYMDPAHIYMYDFLLYRLVRQSQFDDNRHSEP